MAEWIYFIHAPREDFAATMTEHEQALWATHFQRLQRLLAEGTIILVGPTLGWVNTGIAVFEAPRRGGRATRYARGPRYRKRHRPWRAAAVPGCATARAGLTPVSDRDVADMRRQPGPGGMRAHPPRGIRKATPSFRVRHERKADDCS